MYGKLCPLLVTSVLTIPQLEQRTGELGGQLLLPCGSATKQCQWTRAGFGLGLPQPGTTQLPGYPRYSQQHCGLTISPVLLEDEAMWQCQSAGSRSAMYNVTVVAVPHTPSIAQAVQADIVSLAPGPTMLDCTTGGARPAAQLGWTVSSLQGEVRLHQSEVTSRQDGTHSTASKLQFLLTSPVNITCLASSPGLPGRQSRPLLVEVAGRDRLGACQDSLALARPSCRQLAGGGTELLVWDPDTGSLVVTSNLAPPPVPPSWSLVGIGLVLGLCLGVLVCPVTLYLRPRVTNLIQAVARHWRRRQRPSDDAAQVENAVNELSEVVEHGTVSGVGAGEALMRALGSGALTRQHSSDQPDQQFCRTYSQESSTASYRSCNE